MNHKTQLIGTIQSHSSSTLIHQHTNSKHFKIELLNKGVSFHSKATETSHNIIQHHNKSLRLADLRGHHYVQFKSQKVLSPLSFLGVFGFVRAKTLSPHSRITIHITKEQVMHGLVNDGKKENDRYTYAMFNKLLPLAHSLQACIQKQPLIYSGNLEFKRKREHIVQQDYQLQQPISTRMVQWHVLGNLSSLIIAKECKVNLNATTKRY